MSSAVRSAFAGGGGLFLNDSRRRLFSSVSEVLPVINPSQSSFEELRRQRAVYVDKTAFIPELVAPPQHKLITRPRRFGKSLLLDTVRCAFMKPGERKAELFKGLAITQSEAGQRILDMHLPVIHLDLSRVNGTDGKQALEDLLRSMMTDIGNHYGVRFGANDDIGLHLQNLIVAVRRRHRDEYEDTFSTMTEGGIDRLTRVVFLMDEYNAPITQVLKYSKRGIADERLLPNMEVHSGLLTVCKALSSSEFHCSLYTGVSQFTVKGLFSGWDNVKDVSSSEKFGTMLGYTQQEMEENFGPHLRALRDKLPGVDGRLRALYNGYRFGVSGTAELTEAVYNPFCINDVLVDQELGSYFAELTPGWLFSLLEQHHVAELASQLSRWHRKADLFGKQDAEQPMDKPTSAVSLLLQTGYLTLTESRTNEHYEIEVRVGYPNDEARELFTSNYLSRLCGSRAPVD